MINSICICGAGTMGSGIAQVAAQAGFDTILFDLQQEVLEKAKLSIRKGLQLLLDKQKITADQKDAIFSRVLFTNSIADCRAGIIIEAIVEKMEAKVSLFTQLALINDSQTIFASNTSSLSITELQKNIPGPQRLAGMHFFNPAPVMKLVEVVSGELTAEAVKDRIVQLAQQMGKKAVICRDAPGFIVNRVARPYYLEAMKMVELGYAGIETVDTAMQAAGFKMGPFKLMDLIGLDVNYAVSTLVFEQLNQPERLRPSVLQQQKVADGKFGIKKGEGFYLY